MAFVWSECENSRETFGYVVSGTRFEQATDLFSSRLLVPSVTATLYKLCSFLLHLKYFRRTKYQVTCNFFSSCALLLLCCRIPLNGITTLAAARGHSVSGRLTMTSYNNAKQLSRNPTADGSDLVLWLLLKVMVEEARFLEQPAGRLAASHSNMADGSECGGCCCWS